MRKLADFVLLLITAVSCFAAFAVLGRACVIVAAVLVAPWLYKRGR